MRRNKNKNQLALLNCGNAFDLSKPKERVKVKISNKSSKDKLFDNLMDVETTAEVLGVAPKTVRKWVSIRFIPYLKVGRRVMFRPKSLELWLNKKENKSWL